MKSIRAAASAPRVLNLSDDTVAELENGILMFYTGVTRRLWGGVEETAGTDKVHERRYRGKDARDQAHWEGKLQSA